jgi:hypothetical protein
MLVTPAFFRNETAADPLPPVASIGSISSTSVAGNVGRELLVVADRLERFLIAVDAQVPQPRVRQELEDSLGHAQSRP